MKYIDTNILVRIITGDDQVAAQKAIAEIERGATNEFYIADAILVELCFVLEFHTYAMIRADIASAIESLITTPQITVAKETSQALKLYREHPKLDYADCLLFALGGKNGVFTFDKALQRTLLA